MAKKGKRENIKMQSSETTYFYHTEKNKVNTPDRLEIKKYDPIARKHVSFKEKK